MIRHILLFSFAAHADEGLRDAVMNGLRDLPAAFPVIRDFELGPNRSDRDDTYEFGMTMTFPDVATLQGYLTSELHEAFVRTLFRPSIRHRAIVSFEMETNVGTTIETGER